MFQGGDRLDFARSSGDVYLAMPLRLLKAMVMLVEIKRMALS